jgi:hypothetical protein
MYQHLKETAASILRVPYPDDGYGRYLPNVGTYLQNHTMTYPVCMENKVSL